MFKASNAVAPRTHVVDAADHAFTTCVNDHVLSGIVRILGKANQTLDGPRDLCNFDPMDRSTTIRHPIVSIMQIFFGMCWRCGSTR